MIDPTDWTAIATLDGARASILWDLTVSPDGNLVATVGPDEFLQVWNVAEEKLVADIALHGAVGEGLRGIRFEDQTTLLVGPELGGQILRFTLDEALLVQLALDTVTRGFTEEECATFNIDPCLTLEEMRAGS